MVSNNRNSTGRDRRIDEPRTIGLCAGKREEKIARLHRAAVHGEARDGKLGCPHVHFGIVGEKLAKCHGLRSRPIDSNIRMPFQRVFLRMLESENHWKISSCRCPFESEVRCGAR
jgi:hypothetical protein